MTCKGYSTSLMLAKRITSMSFWEYMIIMCWQKSLRHQFLTMTHSTFLFGTSGMELKRVLLSRRKITKTTRIWRFGNTTWKKHYKYFWIYLPKKRQQKLFWLRRGLRILLDLLILSRIIKLNFKIGCWMNTLSQSLRVNCWDWWGSASWIWAKSIKS